MVYAATRDGVPRDAPLHGHKDARDHENERDAEFPHLLGNRDRRKLCGYDLGVAELGDRAVLSRNATIRGVRCDGLLQMILDLLTDTLSQRPVKTQRRRERLQIPGNHAGLRRCRAPARRPPMAWENC